MKAGRGPTGASSINLADLAEKSHTSLTSVGAGDHQTDLSGNAVIPFIGGCPPGWTEYTAARGRAIVGLVDAGVDEGTQGTALTDQEDRPVGQHTHVFIGDALGSHGHVQNSHGHTQNSHDHIQDAHDHDFFGRQAAANTSTILGNSLGGGTAPSSLAMFHTSAPNSGAAHVETIGDKVANNQATVAGNQSSTPTNQTASGGTPAGTNADSGSVAGPSMPYIQLTYCTRD